MKEKICENLRNLRTIFEGENMPVSIERVIQRLQSEGEKTVSFFEAIPNGQWETQVYADGEQWAFRQILSHIVQAESGIARLVAHVLSGG
ncbi:MAG: hypothetical protein GY792_20335, partial [Gammaproteobacteria bacterium]|nr:hypothetical protein [Gammaproteobacteria bacterium]